MASELVKSATAEKLMEIDWTKNIEICETVAQDNRQAKDVIKVIKKRLSSKNPNVQLYSVSLLEMLMNNIGEPIHKEVMDAGLLSILVKIVKKKSDFPVREKIFLLLDATQTSVGGAKGRFPQYYNAYYELVSAGVQFPQPQYTVSSNAASPGTRQINLTVREVANANQDRVPPPEKPKAQVVPESSIIPKATAALEVLREVLDAVDLKNPEAGKDEFTLDLVEQCSFQKQRVMHLVMTSRNERLVSQAIELNEQLGRVLTRHDALLAGKPSTMPNHIDHNILASNNGVRSANPAPTTNHAVNHDEEDEDEAEQLCRRIRKGKARVRPEEEEEEEEEDEGGDGERPFRWLGASMPTEKLHRPLIRPLSMDYEAAGHEQSKPQPPSPRALTIPPPPSKHTEREKFFQEKKGDSAGSLSGHMRGLSLHRRNPSSSYSGGSFDSNE